MNNKLIDLHVHSCYSDGEFTPVQLIEMAKKKDVGTIAITDHDNILGVKSLLDSQIDLQGIDLITGIELTAKVSTGRMHILGYNFDTNNTSLNSKLNEVRSNSINSLLEMNDQLKKDYNINFSHNDIDKLVNSIGNVGRPHLASLCVKYGYASYNQEAFDKYLIPVYQKTRTNSKGLIPEECISIIKEAGGIAVLAHPHSLELDNRKLLIAIKELITYGLEGIEIFHSNNKEEEKRYLIDIVNQYHLLYSGGSDYHGVYIKPDLQLGTGRDNNICIKRLSILDKIKR